MNCTLGLTNCGSPEGHPFGSHVLLQFSFLGPGGISIHLSYNYILWQQPHRSEDMIDHCSYAHNF